MRERGPVRRGVCCVLRSHTEVLIVQPETAGTHPPSEAENRLAAMGLHLPQPARPVAAYVPTVRTGNLLYVSGQIPILSGNLLAQGRVPSEVTVETARRCAVQCALNALAAVKAEIGSLDRVRRVVRLGCFVASEPGFHDQPKVANGASEMLVEIFGDRGRHARAAVGSIDLPLGVPVEIEFLFEVE
ncbi:MAG: RidA family protein [Phycisphaeraceae bacterium]|nr:RidA family protein [Phycisphaeraceae bacterium]